jgi:hypothetical protein
MFYSVVREIILYFKSGLKPLKNDYNIRCPQGRLGVEEHTQNRRKNDLRCVPSNVSFVNLPFLCLEFSTTPSMQD